MESFDPQPGDVSIVEVDLGVSSPASKADGGGRRVPGGRWTVGAAVLAVLALAVGSVAVWRADTGGRATSSERFFELSPVPAGMAAWAPETDRGSAPVGVRMAFFGDPGAEDPFAKADALVNIISSDGSLSEGSAEADSSSTSVRVRATTGSLRSDDAVGFSVRVLTFIEPGRRVIVVSRHLSDDAMIDLANALGEGAEPVLTTKVAGLSLVAAASSYGTPFAADGTSRVVMYLPANGSSVDGGPLTLSFGPGGADALRVARWWGGVPTTVDGHRGMVVSLSTGTSTGLNRIEWLLEDGTLVTLSGPRSVDELRALAATVREVDRARWDELVASPGPFTVPSQGAAATGATGVVTMTPTSEGPVRASVSGSLAGIEWVVEDRGTLFCLRRGSTADQGELMCAAASLADDRPGAATVVLSLPVDARALVVVPVERGTTAVTMQQPDGAKAALQPMGALGDVDLFAVVVARSPAATQSAGTPFVELQITAANGSSSTRRVIVPALGSPPPAPTTK